MTKWDLFISHAGEDKAGFVRPLAEKLREAGISVWYDEFELNLGDSIRRSIEKGLSGSRFGAVVLSPAFFGKEWPERELDALTSLEIGGKSRILPIWLDVGLGEVQDNVPSLAGRFAIMADDGISAVAEKLIRAIYPDQTYSDADVQSIISSRLEADTAYVNYLISQAHARLEALAAYRGEVDRIRVPDSVEEEPFGFEKYFDPLVDEDKRKYSIPPLLYHNEGVPLRRSEVQILKALVKRWIKGRLSGNQAYDLLFTLDEDLDMDWLYVLFGLPNFSVSRIQQSALREAVITIGARNSADKSFDWHDAYNSVISDRYGSKEA